MFSGLYPNQNTEETWRRVTTMKTGANEKPNIMTNSIVARADPLFGGPCGSRSSSWSHSGLAAGGSATTEVHGPPSPRTWKTQRSAPSHFHRNLPLGRAVLYLYAGNRSLNSGAIGISTAGSRPEAHIRGKRLGHLDFQRSLFAHLLIVTARQRDTN